MPPSSDYNTIVSDRPQEFWEEENSTGRREMRRYALRWMLIFAVLIGGIFFAIWWSSSAVRFSSSRVQQSTGPTYRVSGIVRDTAGKPVPWAEITDELSGRPPLFHTTADRFGAFELLTIAEPHKIQASALGYKPAVRQIGKAWYMWMPKGAEKIEIVLPSE